MLISILLFFHLFSVPLGLLEQGDQIFLTNNNEYDQSHQEQNSTRYFLRKKSKFSYSVDVNWHSSTAVDVVTPADDLAQCQKYFKNHTIL